VSSDDLSRRLQHDEVAKTGVAEQDCEGSVATLMDVDD